MLCYEASLCTGRVCKRFVRRKEFFKGYHKKEFKQNSCNLKAFYLEYVNTTCKHFERERYKMESFENKKILAEKETQKGKMKNPKDVKM